MAATTAQMPEAPTADNIDVSLQISLPQLLDLALGAPEVGAVNFNILHNFLHVLLHQVNLQATKVEYRGENADRIKRMLTSVTPTSALQLHENNIIDATGEVKQQIRRDNGADSKEVLKMTEDARQQGFEKDERGVDKSVAAADASLINARMNKLEDKVSNMEQWLTNLQAVINVLTEDVIAPTTTEGAAVKDEEAAAEPAETATKKMQKPTPDKLASQLALMSESGVAEIRQDVITLKTDVERVQQELRNLINERVAQIPTVKEPIEDKEKMEVTNAAKLEECLEAVKDIKATHGKVLQRVVTLETEIGHLLEKVESVQETDKAYNTEISKFVARVQEIETGMEKIEQAMGKLLEDKEKQGTDINTLLEQIELLKTVKANKEEFEDALADKADTQTVNRKVSHDQFDAACDDFARGLEEAIDKLTKQESIWQQALDEVQNEISAKMDKVEMAPLKDFVNDKLKSLQEKLKIIVEARREIEAAGTKKLLRDVQCISCDKDVVMKTEEVARFYAESLPCTTSIKPYLTYKLDQVRKQQKRLPHSRNMIQFEAAMQEETKKVKAKEEMLARTPRDNFCNRYCGGSHTITTPQQRIARAGHFLTQWGPEIIQLTDGLIRGKDGQMYRSRPVAGKSDVCGPAGCWESQISEETARLSECASTAPRKSLSSRRNNAGNQKRTSRKESRESKVSEPEEKSIEEVGQVTAPQENEDRPPLIPAEFQDEITLYETNADT